MVRDPVSAEHTNSCSNTGATAAALLPIFDEVGRHRPPAEHGQAFFDGNAVDERAQLRLDLVVVGRKIRPAP